MAAAAAYTSIVAAHQCFHCLPTRWCCNPLLPACLPLLPLKHPRLTILHLFQLPILVPSSLMSPAPSAIRAAAAPDITPALFSFGNLFSYRCCPVPRGGVGILSVGFHLAINKAHLLTVEPASGNLLKTSVQGNSKEIAACRLQEENQVDFLSVTVLGKEVRGESLKIRSDRKHERQSMVTDVAVREM